jgi:hypothetical protein
MLNVPEVGVRPYSDQRGHQSDLSIFTDWLEGSVLFGRDDSLSIAEIKDTLTDEHIYEDQDKASEFLTDVWTEIRRRKVALGNSYPIACQPTKLARTAAWRDAPAYAFCLLLSYSDRYPEWRKSFGNDFTEQGLLFERVTELALNNELSEWTSHSTGWSRTQTAQIKDSVETVRGLLNEKEGRIDLIPDLNTIKDAGLDIVLWRPFPDSRNGCPLYLVQCASGANWEEKRTQPEINLWRTMIEFAAIPKRALAIPYAISDDEFWISCRRMDGMLLDRLRLLSGGRRSARWLTQDVNRRVVAWMRPRVKDLPTM